MLREGPLSMFVTHNSPSNGARAAHLLLSPQRFAFRVSYFAFPHSTLPPPQKQSPPPLPPSPEPIPLPWPQASANPSPRTAQSQSPPARHSPESIPPHHSGSPSNNAGPAQIG